MELHVYVHVVGDAGPLDAKLDQVIGLLTQSIGKENAMSKELDDLTAEVHANTTVVGSALTLIQGLADKLAAAGTDPVKLQALRDELAANDAALAAAVAANTGA